MVQREGAVAVRARYAGGRPLADARYEVQSPRGGAAPFVEGRTDRHGWVAFTPDVPGTWKVRIADATGHGRTVVVEVRSTGGAPVPAPGPAAAVGPPPPDPLPPRRGGRGGIGADAAPPPEADAASGVLRALGGVAAIAALFGVLLAVQRARRAKGR